MLYLSVIIPIYNVSRYIERCVHSLMRQTMNDGIEFIFIDDCSTDDSVLRLDTVLTQYPERFGQVRRLRMEQNSGQAAVRTCGIKAAQGEFIIHCDSDDWVEPDMYECLVAKAKETDADIVTSWYYVNEGKGDRVCKESQEEMDGKTVMANLYRKPCITVSLWNKLIRRAIFIEHGLFPFEGINVGEDSGLFYRVLYFSRKIAYLSRPFYHYDLTRGTSISHADKYKRWGDAKRVIALVDDFYKSMSDYERFRLSLDFLKFQFKTDFVFDKTNFAEWKNTFPETNRQILKFSILPIRTRLIYCFYAYVKISRSH